MTPITRNGLIEHGFVELGGYFIRTGIDYEISVGFFDNNRVEISATWENNIMGFSGCKTIEQLDSLWGMFGEDLKPQNTQCRSYAGAL